MPPPREGSAGAEREQLPEVNEASRLKDDLLGTVSHELRTPLNAILGWAQLALMSGQADQLVRQALQVIERNARIQARLIDDLLDVSRIATGKIRLRLERVALNDCLRAAIDTLRPTADVRHVAVVVGDLADEDVIVGDSQRLQQVFWNVLANAIKFTPSGGRVTVRTSCHEGQVELRVADTGVGIDPMFLPFVFDRYRQADNASQRRYAGLGIGLSIVKHLTELHGGNVRVQSAGLGAGTTISLGFPLEQTPGTVSQVGQSKRKGKGNLNGCNMLVVADDVDTARLLEIALRGEGASVEIACCVEGGLRSIAEALPNLVLIDLTTPGEKALALLKAIRISESPSLGTVPVVAVTNSAREDERERVLASGFDACLRKPIDLVETLHLLVDLCNGKTSTQHLNSETI